MLVTPNTSVETASMWKQEAARQWVYFTIVSVPDGDLVSTMLGSQPKNATVFVSVDPCVLT